MELGRDRVQTQSRKNKNNLRDRQNDQDVAVSSSADENVNEGISQRKLAEILGIDRAYLTNWQQSKNNAIAATLAVFKFWPARNFAGKIYSSSRDRRPANILPEKRSLMEIVLEP